MTSRIGFWPWYVLPLGVFLLAEPGLGLLAWGTYGFTRLAVLTLVAALMRAGDAADRMTTWLLTTRSGIRPAMTAAAIAGAVVVAVAAA